MANAVGVPVFLQLAGHELRWALLSELARSDLRVRELVALLDEPQNLISYHLGKLRAAGIVTTRRSSADGRDVYYHLDLTRCANLLAEAATALHPGLAQPRPGGPISPPVRVLFLCTGNSARSPMAAALLRHHGGDSVRVASAGSDPKPLHPYAVRALDEVAPRAAAELSGHRPSQVKTLTRRRFDYVISLCDRVREVCPEFPQQPTLIHWSIPNPGGTDGTDGYDSYRRTAAELDARIRFLLARLDGRAGG